MLLYVQTWTLCWWKAMRCFSLYVPGVSAGGGHGDGSPCTYLESLLLEDRKMLLSARTWKYFFMYITGLSAGGGQGIASLCTYLDYLLVEKR